MVWLNSLISCGEPFTNCNNGNTDGLENTVASLCENSQGWSVSTKYDIVKELCIQVQDRQKLLHGRADHRTG